MKHTKHIVAGHTKGMVRMLHGAAFFVVHSFLLLLMLTACSTDSTDDGGVTPNSSEKTGRLQLRIATQDNHVTTRADWTDNNATDDEMMNLWVVVVTDASSGSVQKCFACRPTTGAAEQEIDEVGTIDKGAYKVYSFANISVTNVCSLLGLAAPSVIPTIGSTPTEISLTGTVNHTTVAAQTATVNGNGFDPTATDNGFGEAGIPMSNVQDIAATETEKDLIVIRMLVKLEIQLFNETSSAVTVQAVTLSDVTSNAAGNLKLLPQLTTGANTMDAVHQDIQPNLGSGATTAEYTYDIPSAKQTVAVSTYSSGTPSQTLTFYVNESATPGNGDGLFYLTLKLSDTEYRYALVSDNADNEWNYMARNDYRIIPIVLDDYKLELVPYDFPPIGVYPCSVKEIESDLYEMTFHDYGHFHLVPKVTKISDNSAVVFSSTTPSGTAWTLNTDWDDSFKTAATKGGTWLDASGITANGFYRDQSATVDGDEVGGAPVWYANTSSPQWDPAGGTDYQPFIFGYIADPGASFTDDKQIYHEFRIKLYVGGTYRRDMLYRFYMTLSADQMVYAPALHATAPHRRH